MSEDLGDHLDVSSVEEISIQDVIQARKEERKLIAEQKRQMDLQRIRDMKSDKGIDPLQRFPEEIWSMILDELEPEEKGNICKVHPMFRDMLETYRIRDILLPQIVKVIQTKFEKYLWPDDEFYYFNEQLRRISRSTRQSFDRWTEDNLIQKIKKERANSFSDSSGTVNLSFNEEYERLLLKSLLRSYGENKGKRFFPRGIAVSFSDEDVDIDEEDIPKFMNQFKKDLVTLLKIIGDQVWHFRFFVGDLQMVEFSYSKVYIMLQKYISLMPNLRWLEVSIYSPSSKEKLHVSKSALQKHPLLPLAKLERLSLYSSEKMGGFHHIYEIILGANPQIKMLDLCNDLSNVPVHLIQHLPLTAFNTFDLQFHDRSTSLQRVQHIANFNWPLQTITLGLQYDTASLNNVFRFLERFPTLERVELKPMKGFPISDTAKKLGYLKLPNLSNYQLMLCNPNIDYESDINFLFSLQFLVHCKKLKRLRWKLQGYNDTNLRNHLKEYESENVGNMIDFRAGLTFLYDSNIWDVFPFLEFLRIENKKNGGKGVCSHVYMRATLCKSMSMRQLLKIHGCSRDGSLAGCVMLRD